MLPGIVYLLFALVAFVSAYRAGGDGGGKQRIGMAAAGIGFALLSADRFMSAKTTSNQTMLIAAGVLLVGGVVLYWWGHLKS